MLPSLLSLFTEKPREPRRSKMAEKRSKHWEMWGEWVRTRDTSDSNDERKFEMQYYIHKLKMLKYYTKFFNFRYLHLLIAAIFKTFLHFLFKGI
jgi:hypothetical protein